MDSPVSFESFIASFPKDGTLIQQIESLLKGAMRAPSTHNSQPWRFRIEPDSVVVLRDSNVVLPNSDKETQYAHISIGFLLHHIQILGQYLGMLPDIQVLVDGTSIAKIHFSQSTSFNEKQRPLAEAIFKRRNRRGNFTKDSIPKDLLTELSSAPSELPTGLPLVLPQIIADPSATRRIGELTLETMVRLYDKSEFRGEMSRWIVPSNSSKKVGIPGYSLNQPLLLSIILPKIIRNFNIGKLPGKLSAEAIASAPVLFAFGSDSNPASWLSIGYDSSRIMLTLVANRFDASVYVATAELPDIREEAMKLAGLNTQLRFLFAAGKLEGNASWQTPRVQLADKLDK